MHFEFPHKFSKEEALARLRLMLSRAHASLPEKVTIDEERWEGDTLNFAFTAQGQHISGTTLVNEHAYVVDAKLPLLLRPFSGQIEKMIHEQIAAMLK